MPGSPRKRARRTAAELARQQPSDDRIQPQRLKLAAEKRPTRTLTAEVQQQLADARARANEERKVSKREIKDDAMRTLWPKAFQVMEMALDGAIERGVADRDAINAAFKLWEHKFGKPMQTQKIEADTTAKVIYEAAPYNFLAPSEN